MTGKLELPFDAGIPHGLRVYSKRAICWAAIVLCNSLAFVILYGAATYPSLALGGVAFSLLVGLLLCLVRIGGFKIAFGRSPARFKLIKLETSPVHLSPLEESASIPQLPAKAPWTLIPSHIGLRRAIVPALAAASCLLGAVVTTRILEYRSESLKDQISALRKNANITVQEVASLQRKLADAETAAKAYDEQPQVTIRNNTMFAISMNIKPIESGTQLKVDLQPGEMRSVRVLPGSYRIHASMRGPATIADDTSETRVFEQGDKYSLTYSSTSFPLRTLTVDNETGSTLNISFVGGRIMIVPAGRRSVQVPPGNYSISVTTRCGSRTDSLTNQTASVTYTCVRQ